MAVFDAWDVVKVPFPYADRPVRQRRPALVVAANGIQHERGLLWVLMITSEGNRPWPGDVRLGEGFAAAGLPAPSMVRTLKIATIEASVADRLGAVSPATLDAVRVEVKKLLGPRA